MECHTNCKMRFSKGTVVEVSRRDGGYDSWFKAKIASGNGCNYRVQHENLLNSEGDFVLEDIPEEAIRPVPPVMKGLGRLMVGDCVEVYDCHAWKAAEIAATLPNKCFKLRLLGSSRVKTCHLLTLRPWLFWKDGEWVRFQQAPESQGPHMDSKSAKRKHEFGAKSALMSEVSNKRRATQQRRVQLEKPSPSWLRKVVPYPFPGNNMRKECAYEPFYEERLNYQTRDDDEEESIASCSDNYLPYKVSRTCLIVNNVEDDAQSSNVCQSYNESESLSREEVKDEMEALVSQNSKTMYSCIGESIHTYQSPSKGFDNNFLVAASYFLYTVLPMALWILCLILNCKLTQYRGFSLKRKW